MGVSEQEREREGGAKRSQRYGGREIYMHLTPYTERYERDNNIT